MSWFNSAWDRRRAISVNNLTGSATIDVTATLPADDDDFWSTVKSAGEDIRITDSDGRTLLTYDLDTFSVANRTGTLEIDNWTPGSADAIVMAWLYYGNAAAAAASTVFAPAAAKTGTIALATPAVPIVGVTPERPGETTPRSKIAKISTETIHVWWDLRRVLQRRKDKFAGSDLLEEVSYANVEIYNAAGAAQVGMRTLAATLYVHPGWVRTTILGGTTAVDYTAELVVGTSQGRILRPRALLQVRDVKAA